MRSFGFPFTLLCVRTSNSDAVRAVPSRGGYSYGCCTDHSSGCDPLGCLQARIVALNASYFLKQGGHFVISIKANCIDSTVPAEAVFAREVTKLQAEQFKPAEQLTLEPYERDHACVVGAYRVAKKAKVAA